MTRAHVVLSDEVLEAVDGIVGKRGRSRFIEQAAREKLERLALADALEATRGIATERHYPHWRDREQVVDWVRRGRRDEPAG